jgi:hypothetical protein
MEASSSGVCSCCSRSFNGGARGLSGHLDQSPDCSSHYSREMFSRHSRNQRSLARTNIAVPSHWNPGSAELGSPFGGGGVDDVNSAADDDQGSLPSLHDRFPGELDDPGAFDDGDDLDGPPTSEPDELPDDGFGPPDPEVTAPQQQRIFTPDDEVEVLLMSLLDRLRCPLYAFDAIMEWGAYAQKRGYDMTTGRRPKRRSLVRTIRQKLKQEHMRPETIEHVFTNATMGDVGKIVRFDFVSCLRDLLLDTDLMALENLVINPDAPYSKYVSPDGLLDEINSGCWYDRAHTKEITDEYMFLLPLLFYIDKTGITQMCQRFGLEPLKVTSSIFKRFLRNKSKAWRTIGFMYDLYHMSSAENRQREVGHPSSRPLCCNIHPLCTLPSNSARLCLSCLFSDRRD